MTHAEAEALISLCRCHKLPIPTSGQGMNALEYGLYWRDDEMRLVLYDYEAAVQFMKALWYERTYRSHGLRVISLREAS